MKNYIAMHNFHSEELKKKCFEALGSMSENEISSSMTGEKAACQMTWHDGGVGMEMVCWWKAESPDAIIEQIGEMNDFFATDCISFQLCGPFNCLLSLRAGGNAAHFVFQLRGYFIGFNLFL